MYADLKRFGAHDGFLYFTSLLEHLDVLDFWEAMVEWVLVCKSGKSEIVWRSCARPRHGNTS